MAVTAEGARRKERVLCLFDVDGTLTPARQVGPGRSKAPVGSVTRTPGGRKWGLQRRDPDPRGCVGYSGTRPLTPRGRRLGVMGTWPPTSPPELLRPHSARKYRGWVGLWREEAEAASGGQASVPTSPPGFHTPRPGSGTTPTSSAGLPPLFSPRTHRYLETGV